MEDRRKEDRRKLYGKPFLAMLIGGLATAAFAPA